MEIRKHIVYNRLKQICLPDGRGEGKAALYKTIIALLLTLSVLLSGCATPSVTEVAEQTAAIPAFATLFGNSRETSEKNDSPYVAPPFRSLRRARNMSGLI